MPPQPMVEENNEHAQSIPQMQGSGQHLQPA
jgi:hypothetical protein